MMDFLNGLNAETKVLLSLSIILFSGFILTRMTNTLNMPKVSGYILAGILIGPCCLNLIPASMIDGMSFVSDLALAFIAFGVGKFFKKEVLMRTGKRIIIITISEALAAGALVTILLKFMFHLNWEFALILGAIATATAPASTMMTINQYKAKGEFVDTLLQIVALDDVVCLLAFSIVSAIINGNEAGGFSIDDILIPVAYNILVIALGAFCGYFLSRLLVLPTRSRDNRLILVIAMLLGLSGICAAIDISPLLSCMVFGAVYINLTRDKKLFRQINSFTPPVMSLFFIVSGMNLDVRALSAVGAIGVSYFFIRIVGKYLGTYISCLVTKTSSEIRNYMGLALIPQAGVAIGLAFLGQRMLPPETGSMMLTIILSSSVLYEMVGPVSAKAALLLSGSISYGHGKEKGQDKEDAGLTGESEIEKNGIGTLPEGKEETEGKEVFNKLNENENGDAAGKEDGAGNNKISETIIFEEEKSEEKSEEKAEEETSEKISEGQGRSFEADQVKADTPDETDVRETARRETAIETAGEEAAPEEEKADEEKADKETADEETEEYIEAVSTAVQSEEVPSSEASLQSEKAGKKAKHKKKTKVREEIRLQKKESESQEEIRFQKKEAKTQEEIRLQKKESELQEEEQVQENVPEEKETEKIPKDGKLRKKDKTVKGKNSREKEKKAKQKAKKILLEMEEEDLEIYEEEDDELHAVLPELREYSKGVQERDVYDIEKDIKPRKGKKKKKIQKGA